jgi:hypothetical protein
MAERNQGKLDDAALKETNLQIESKIEDLKLNLEFKTAKKAETQTTTQKMPLMNVIKSQGAEAVKNKKLALEVKEMENSIKSNFGETKTKEGRKIIDDKEGEYHNAKTLISRAKAFREKGINWFGAEKKKGAELKSNLIQLIREMDKMGAMDQNEYERLEKRVPNLNDMGHVMAWLEELEKTVDSKFINTINPHLKKKINLTSLGGSNGGTSDLNKMSAALQNTKNLMGN